MNSVSGSVIETQDLRKTYPSLRVRLNLAKAVPALNGVSLRVERGQIFGLIGANARAKRRW